MISRISVGLLLLARASTGLCDKSADFFKETVVQHEVIEAPREQKIDEKMKEEAVRAKGVVKRYWANSCSGAFATFTESYKKELRDFHKITSSKAYFASMFSEELSWARQDYQEVQFMTGFDKKRRIRITVLAEWSFEDVGGVSTFVFELENDPSGWKIYRIISMAGP